MSALPNRILRLLLDSPDGKTPDEICNAFAAYRTGYVTQTVQRLQRLGLVTGHPCQLTQSGRTTAALQKPARWSAPRRSLPRTATIA